MKANNENMDIYKVYPASGGQKRIFIMSKLEEAKVAYNMLNICEISSQYDKNDMINAIHILVDRHDLLRASFVLEESQVIQRIHKKVDYEVQYVEIAENEINRELEKYKSVIFELDTPPLFKFGLIKNKNKVYIIYNLHHIIADGESEKILIRDFKLLCEHKVLPKINVDYEKYVSERMIIKKSSVYKRSKEYWLSQFSTIPEPLELPFDYNRKSRQSFKGKSIQFQLDLEVSDAIHKYCNLKKVSLHALLMATYMIVLSKWSGQNDIVIGVPVTNRLDEKYQNIVGMFVNTVVIRANVDQKEKIDKFIKMISQKTLNAMRFQEYQFDELINELPLEKDLSRNPLYNCTFLYNEVVEVDGSRIEILQNNTSIVDFHLEVRKIKPCIQFIAEYCIELFSEFTCNQIIQTYVQVLKEIVIKNKEKIEDVDYVDVIERSQLLSKINDTKYNYNMLDIPIVLFEKVAIEKPDYVAITFGKESITYGELHIKVSKLAGLLIDLKLDEHQVIAIMMEASISLVIAILAVQKIGGVYLPIDIELPQERIEYMLDDSGAAALLVDDEVKEVLKCTKVILNISKISWEGIFTKNIELSRNENDISYIMYTSGSTGKPKGVMITNKNVANFIMGMRNIISIDEVSTVLSITSISFDISFLELLFPLASGMKIIIRTRDLKVDMRGIMECIEKNGVDVVQTTPSRMQAMTLFKGWKHMLRNVKKIVICGEPFIPDLRNKLNQIPNATVYNMYGPTETTIFSTGLKVIEDNKITIGKPFVNTRIFILDDNKKLIPRGMVGEIYIAGDGVGKGYCGKDDITKQRFVYLEFEQGISYRSGDKGRWLENGEIEYLGRNDFQVKVRGYRIEVEEIESELMKIKNILHAVVIAHDDKKNGKYLCAYMELDGEISSDDISKALREKLPYYMIPTFYVKVEKLPINQNGKINRSLLLPPKLEKAEVKLSRDRKSDKYYEGIYKVWEKIFKYQEFTDDDGFFDVGGNSLMAIHAEAMFESCGIPLKIQDIYQYKTINALNDYLEGREIFKEKDANEQKNIENYTKNQNTEIKVESIEDMLPFNGLFVESCFYNSIFTIMNYFKRNELIFINEYKMNYEYNKNEKKLSIGCHWAKEFEAIINENGIGVVKYKNVQYIIHTLLDALENKHPAIIWIDCFYASARKDMYYKQHWQHTIVVCGCDKEKREFNIIEHKEKDSLIYSKEKISFDELEKCYRGYCNNFSGEDSDCLEVFVEKDFTTEIDQINPVFYDWNVSALYECIEEFEKTELEFTNGCNISELVEILNDIINCKYIEKYKINCVHAVKESLLNEIINEWSDIRAWIAKIHYGSKPSKQLKSKVYKKLLRIVELETEYGRV